jgi:endonuclease/exonuclease/phosphatase family metal-dependent hydrolase
MSFNIEWGGTHVDFNQVTEAIRRSGADIVGIQEAEGNLQRLAGELGWHYDLRHYIISRFPLLDASATQGRYLYVEVEPGRVIAMANLHLPSEMPGPHELRDGVPVDRVLETERRVRLAKLQPYLDAVAALPGDDIPVFVTGDFNAPSHADWIPSAIGTRRFLDQAVDWPVSRAMAAAGFHDAWREVYPDPVANPGLTWWAGRPPLESYAPDENDPQDRIDFVWFAGAVEVQGAELVGETGAPDVSISIDPWPSDHRGVVSEFTVWPADMPAFVDAGRWVYHLGEHVDVRFHYPVDVGLTITVWRVGETPVLLERRINNGSGHSVFEAGMFSPGPHRAVLQNGDGSVRLHSDFWILDPDSVPEVSVESGSVLQGEPVTINWRNGPGNRNDYLAVYEAETPAGYGNELAWTYVSAMPEGRILLDASTAEAGWPLDPGTYRILLMKDDGYQPLAESASFIVE